MRQDHTRLTVILHRSGSMDKAARNDRPFVFLSAVAAVGDAEAVGISRDSTLFFERSSKGSAKVWDSLSARISDFRAARKQMMEFEEGGSHESGRGGKCHKARFLEPISAAVTNSTLLG